MAFRIHALSGTGAGAGLFPEPWSTLPGFVAHEWPPYRGERTIAELARSCVDAWDVQDGDVLVGTSLGGMVACEMARLKRIPRIYLVASAVSPKELARPVAFLHPLAQLLPMSVLWWAAGRVPGEVTRMFHASDPRFVRAMCRAIFTWPGAAGTPSTLVRVHGARDRMIPSPSNPDFLIQDAGHLIAFTRAPVCVRFIQMDLQAHLTP